MACQYSPNNRYKGQQDERSPHPNNHPAHKTTHTSHHKTPFFSKHQPKNRLTPTSHRENHPHPCHRVEERHPTNSRASEPPQECRKAVLGATLVHYRERGHHDHHRCSRPANDTSDQ